MAEDSGAAAGAQAKFALFLASLFQRAGVATMGEFAELLSVFADSVAETEPGEAAVLKTWAQAIAGVGQ